MGLEAVTSTKSSLAPGFRFHPTDEELVRYYLRRKICGKPFRFDAISDLDIYKVEPWDLPGKSRLKSRDLEWYFFTVLDKKYGNGSRTNRATDGGYWKTTGKDRAVYHRTKIVGMKKTLVYHSGRAPRGERTNWVMHEYRLIDEEMEKAGILQDAFVLCRIFRKSGSGPKNGEQYGAPFIDEEWEEDELVMVPKNEYTEELPVSDDAFSDACLDENDIEQILNAADSSHQAPVPLNSVYDDEYQYLEEPANFNEENQEVFVGVDENNLVHEQPDGTTLFNLPVQSDMDITVKHEYIGEPSYFGDSSNTENPVDVDYLLDEPYLDALDNPQFTEGSFIETNDLKPSAEAGPSSFEMLDEYLQYFDSTDGNLEYSGFDYSNMLESEDLPSDTTALLSQEVIPKDVNEDIKQETFEETHLAEVPNNDVSSSSRPEQPEFGSDFHYPFTSCGSRMLGNIPADPAFASEYPRKDAALHFNSASPSSIRVTAGIIQIQSTSLRGTGIDWSFGKDGCLNVTFSFSLSRVDNYSADTATAFSVLPDKGNSALYRGWFYFMCMWVLFLTMSFKIGSYICAK